MTIYTIYFLLACFTGMHFNRALAHSTSGTHKCIHDSLEVELQVNHFDPETAQNKMRQLATVTPLPIRISMDYRSLNT